MLKSWPVVHTRTHMIIIHGLRLSSPLSVDYEPRPLRLSIFYFYRLKARYELLYSLRPLNRPLLSCPTTKTTFDDRISRRFLLYRSVLIMILRTYPLLSPTKTKCTALFFHVRIRFSASPVAVQRAFIYFGTRPTPPLAALGINAFVLAANRSLSWTPYAV